VRKHLATNGGNGELRERARETRREVPGNRTGERRRYRRKRQRVRERGGKGEGEGRGGRQGGGNFAGGGRELAESGRRLETTEPPRPRAAVVIVVVAVFVWMLRADFLSSSLTLSLSFSRSFARSLALLPVDSSFSLLARVISVQQYGTCLCSSSSCSSFSLLVVFAYVASQLPVSFSPLPPTHPSSPLPPRPHPSSPVCGLASRKALSVPHWWGSPINGL